MITLTSPTTGPVHGHAAPGDRVTDTLDTAVPRPVYRVIHIPHHPQDVYLLLDLRTLATRRARSLSADHWRFTS